MGAPLWAPFLRRPRLISVALLGENVVRVWLNMVQCM
jgi:hypothetical protein